MGRASLGDLSQEGHDSSIIQISVAIDGSEDSKINISGLEDYKVGKSKDKATDDDIDPFEDVD